MIQPPSSDSPAPPPGKRQKLFIAAADSAIGAQPETEAPRPRSVGTILAETRESQGFSVAEIAARLRIRAPMLLALEQDDYAALPAPIYALGFLRGYASFLGLNADALSKQYRHEATLPGAGDYCLPAIEQPGTRPAALALWLSVLALIVVAGIASWQLNLRTRLLEAIPPLPERLATPTTTHEGRVFGDSTNNHIVLHAHDKIWIDVRDDRGSLLLTQMLEAGDRYHVPNRPGLRLSTSNAGMVSVAIDGVDRGRAGTSGAALREIMLDSANLETIIIPPAPPPPNPAPAATE